jgi:hypothetical protein
MSNGAQQEQQIPATHHCIVRGETSDGPFQRVYITHDADEAERFNYIMEQAEHTHGLKRGDIGKLVESEFPGLILILEQHGNDITESVPDTLPIGEGYWDEHDHVQLLRRALMATENEWKDSLRKAGNEMASNLPTLLAIGVKGDAGYWFAGACGLGIAASIGYRGHRQNQRFNRALTIFVEFMNNKSINPDIAKEVLDKRMRSSGLLFSGVPKTDLSKFDEDHYITIADKRGLWYNKNYLSRRLHSRALPDSSAEVEISPEFVAQHSRKVLKKTAHFIGEQLLDFANNPRSPETWKNIGRGAVDFAILSFEFRNKVSRNRVYRDMVKANPELGGGRITIEDHEHVRAAADHNILEEISVTKADVIDQKRDGMVMNAAFAMEAGFMGAHIYEVGHAGHELYDKYTHDEAESVEAAPVSVDCENPSVPPAITEGAQSDAADLPPPVTDELQGPPRQAFDNAASPSDVAAEPSIQPCEAPSPNVLTTEQTHQGNESWMDDPEAAVALGIYSIFMASGAFSYLGREITSIKNTLQSSRARVLSNLYPRAMEQYQEFKMKQAEADGPATPAH